MEKIVWHPVTRRLIETEARMRMLEERVDAQSMVLSWLLARCPGDEGLRFLSRQANELDQSEPRQKHLVLIDLLDDLSARVAELRALQPSVPEQQ